MLSLADNAEDERVKLAALKELADRGWGRAKEIVEVETTLSAEEYAEELWIIGCEYVASLPLEERRKLLAEPNESGDAA